MVGTVRPSVLLGLLAAAPAPPAWWVVRREMERLPKPNYFIVRNWVVGRAAAVAAAAAAAAAKKVDSSTRESELRREKHNIFRIFRAPKGFFE